MNNAAKRRIPISKRYFISACFMLGCFFCSQAGLVSVQASQETSQENLLSEWKIFPDSSDTSNPFLLPLTEKETEAATEIETETETETEADTELRNVLERETEADSSASGTAAKPPVLFYTLIDYHEMADYPLPDLPKTIHTLKAKITRLTNSYSGNWSVYVKNLSTYEYFVINYSPMKSASTMKLFIMGAVYEAIDQSELERTTEIVDLLGNMIRYSSNEAANRLLNLLGEGSYDKGIDKVNQYISDHGYSSMTHEYNGFEDSSTVLDSEHFNQTSAWDCGKLLERIYRRTFASRKVCTEIENWMLNQNTRYKIPKGLPDGVEVGNKTGEMDTVENDAAIVYSDACDYILCVFSNDWDSKDTALTQIQEISAAVYDFFNED
ncbi:MAG: class A beta-lactamase-related serine hydrolase [Lachnospiraceae bacterium]|nr:class A beta-lactamase-related serine hydrolase [Lachnospiraceae bacterium]